MSLNYNRARRRSARRRIVISVEHARREQVKENPFFPQVMAQIPYYLRFRRR